MKRTKRGRRAAPGLVDWSAFPISPAPPLRRRSPRLDPTARFYRDAMWREGELHSLARRSRDAGLGSLVVMPAGAVLYACGTLPKSCEGRR